MTNNTIKVFTDGSCINNGRKNKNAPVQAGYAVVFPDHPEWNEAKAIPDGTNIRAEMTAIIRAFQIASTLGKVDDHVTIYTDSQFTINVVMLWMAGWKRRGWKLNTGKSIANHDLVLLLYNVSSEFVGRFTLQHVRAHTGGDSYECVWNAEADKLAQRAAVAAVAAVVGI
jgi:ribonuclease HI